jgi:pimeloyl-ACP methyl ester carboxylesterase
MRYAKVDGLQIAYVREGEGPPLVLLHGGVSDSRSWRRQVTAFADAFTVLAWDAPGAGQSSDIPSSWRLSDYADALAAWLETMDIQRAHLLGLSWGSSVALEFYRRHPDYPETLVLASAYAGWAGSLPPAEVDARLEAALTATDLPNEQMLASWPGLFSSSATAEVRRTEAAISAENTGLRHPGGYRAVVLSMAEADLREMLGEIEVPTLLIYGELDERSPVAIANQLHSEIPTSELVILPGVGHLAHAEAPIAFNTVVCRFLRSCLAQ